MSTPGVCQNIIEERQESNGVGTLKNPKKFLDQDYELLRQCYLIRNRRYVDDMFPPDNSSIGENLLPPKLLDKVEWIRPMVFHQNIFLWDNCENDTTVLKPVLQKKTHRKFLQ